MTDGGISGSRTTPVSRRVLGPPVRRPRAITRARVAGPGCPAPGAARCSDRSADAEPDGVPPVVGADHDRCPVRTAASWCVDRDRGSERPSRAARAGATATGGRRRPRIRAATRRRARSDRDRGAVATAAESERPRAGAADATRAGPSCTTDASARLTDHEPGVPRPRCRPRSDRPRAGASPRPRASDRARGGRRAPAIAAEPARRPTRLGRAAPGRPSDQPVRRSHRRFDDVALPAPAGRARDPRAEHVVRRTAPAIWSPTCCGGPAGRRRTVLGSGRAPRPPDPDRLRRPAASGYADSALGHRRHRGDDSTLGPTRLPRRAVAPSRRGAASSRGCLGAATRRPARRGSSEARRAPPARCRGDAASSRRVRWSRASAMPTSSRSRVQIVRGSDSTSRTAERTMATPKGGQRRKMSGGVLLSHAVSHAVPSALTGLASGFGMGPGVSLSLWPP